MSDGTAPATARENPFLLNECQAIALSSERRFNGFHLSFFRVFLLLGSISRYDCHLFSRLIGFFRGSCLKPFKFHCIFLMDNI